MTNAKFAFWPPHLVFAPHNLMQISIMLVYAVAVVLPNTNLILIPSLMVPSQLKGTNVGLQLSQMHINQAQL
jgi:hypothetical protein